MILFVKRVIFNNLQKGTNNTGITIQNSFVKVTSFIKWFSGAVINMLIIISRESSACSDSLQQTAHAYFLTHTHNPFNGPFSRTTRVSWYQKGKTNLDFTEARDSEWQWHRLDHMQVCISLQPEDHASTPPLSFLQAGCPSCHPTNSVKALKAHFLTRSKVL